MGSALAAAAVQGSPGSVFLFSNRTAEKAAALAGRLGTGSAVPSRETAERASLIFLGVKPQMLGDVFAETGEVLRGRLDRFVLVSMAAGVTCSRIRELAGMPDCPVIRIMPNTPAAIGAGVIQVCSEGATAEETAEFLALMKPAGLLDQIPENLMDAASAVSGCGPAYAYLFIEALADGGVACGLPRDRAQAWAAQTVLGAAQMVLESGKHPGALKDAVTSPGGSTIQGVRALENRGFRAAAMEAVIAGYEKTGSLGK